MPEDGAYTVLEGEIEQAKWGPSPDILCLKKQT